MSEVKNKYAFFKKSAAAAAAAAVPPPAAAAPADTTSPPPRPLQADPPPAAAAAVAVSALAPAAAAVVAAPLAHQVAPRNPFALQVAQGAGGRGALQSRSIQPLSIPTRSGAQQPPSSQQHIAPNAFADSSSFSSSSAATAGAADRPLLRKRIGSPLAADPMVGAPAFPSNIGPSPRASAVAANAAAGRNARVNAVNTPGGNNVVFQLPKQSDWTGVASPRGAAPAAASSGSTSFGHTQSAGANSDPFFSTTAPINPFANNSHLATRGKRKYSDPDVQASLLGGGGRGAHSAAHSASFLSKLRSGLAAPFVFVWRKIKGKDSKKDDDAGRGPGPQSNFAAHKFSALYPDDDSSTDLSPNLSTRIVTACSWRNVLFFFVMSLVVGAVYLWATHECEEDEMLLGLADPLHPDSRNNGAASSPGEGGHLHPGNHLALNPASEPGGVVASSWLPGASLQDFEMKYPFLHPVLHFFKRPVDHSQHVASITQPSVEFTLVSLLRDMTPDFLAENKASYIFQYNSLLSWIRLTPHVIIYMDSQDSCTQLTQRAEFKSQTRKQHTQRSIDRTLVPVQSCSPLFFLLFRVQPFAVSLFLASMRQ